MKKIFKVLGIYLSEHPADMGLSDSESILDFLYIAYGEARESDSPKIKALFAQLGEYLETLPLTKNNAMFFIIIKLCTEHERRAFEEGIRWGFGLHSEILEKEEI